MATGTQMVGVRTLPMVTSHERVIQGQLSVTRHLAAPAHSDTAALRIDVDANKLQRLQG